MFKKRYPVSLKGYVTDDTKNPIAEVSVSNGYDVVQTDSKGLFSLKKTGKENFLFISTPSGFKTNTFFHRVVSGVETYDFTLEQVSYESAEFESFLHISDTETYTYTSWINEIRDYAEKNNSSFIIHTGDINDKRGMDFHLRNVNPETMGKPVYYALGNHDLTEGSRGEEYFEKCFGPVYYSFNSGGIHYVVTPIEKGDYRPSYGNRQIARWLKKDLEAIPEGMPVIMFNHDFPDFNTLLTRSKADLSRFNVIGWGSGHWHTNYIHQNKKGLTAWTVSPPKGGIDHSTGGFFSVEVRGGREIRVTSHYPFFSAYALSPAPSVALAYDTTSATRSVRLHYKGEDGRKQIEDFIRKGTFTWTRERNNPVPENALLQVFLEDGREAQGKYSDTPGKVKHLINLKSSVYMTSPLLVDDKLYTASIDDSGQGEHYIYCVHSGTGELTWKYRTKQSVRNSIAYYKGRIGAADADSNIYILDSSTGLERHVIPGQMNSLPQNMSGSVQLDGIFYGGYGRGLKAVNMENGDILWENSRWDKGEGTVSDIVCRKDLLLAGSNWKGLYGHDRRSGRLLWKNADSKVRFQSSAPIFIDHGILCFNLNRINLLDRKSGKVLKSIETSHDFQVAGKPALDGNILYCPTKYSGMVAFDLEAERFLWETPVGEALIYTAPYTCPGEQIVASVESSPILIKDTLYFGASDGYIYGLNKHNGSVKRKIPVGLPILTSLCADIDYLYAADYDGNLWKVTI